MMNNAQGVAKKVMRREQGVATSKVFIYAREGQLIKAIDGKVAVKNVSTNTNLEVLREINRTLETLDNKYFDGRIVNINTISYLQKIISNKTFLFWLADGKYSDGKLVDEVELNEWRRFAELHAKNYTKVRFMNVLMYRDAGAAKKLWDMIKGPEF